jgi:hypothetical protein
MPKGDFGDTFAGSRLGGYKYRRHSYGRYALGFGAWRPSWSSRWAEDSTESREDYDQVLLSESRRLSVLPRAPERIEQLRVGYAHFERRLTWK